MAISPRNLSPPFPPSPHATVTAEPHGRWLATIFIIFKHFRLVDTDMTWIEGAGFCESDGGFLTSIVSDAERSWLTSTFNLIALNKDIHLGLTDADQEGKITGKLVF